MLDNAHSIVEATSLPVSADLEDGFGASPDDCAQTVRAAEQVGLCGGSIEDATGNSDKPIYSFDLAVERVRAAVAAKTRSEFLITARANNSSMAAPTSKTRFAGCRLSRLRVRMWSMHRAFEISDP